MNNKTLSWDNLKNYSSVVAIYPNGRQVTLSYIDRTLPAAQWKELDALHYFGETGATKGIPLELVSDSLIGKDQLKEVKEWSVIRASLIQTTINDESFKSLLLSLESKNISSVVINDLLKEWDIKKNESDFISAVEKTYIPSEKTLIFKALELIKRVHATPQKDDKPDLPYYNHPVVVATYAIQLGLDSNAVIAALLHDVIEDTDETETMLRITFPEKSIDYVVKMTKKKEEERDTYLGKFSTYSEEVKTLKSLDRFHNLLRAFTFINKPKYWERYINETEKHFYPEFMKNQLLSPFVLKFYRYLEELKKLLASSQQ